MVGRGEETTRAMVSIISKVGGNCDGFDKDGQENYHMNGKKIKLVFFDISASFLLGWNCFWQIFLENANREITGRHGAYLPVYEAIFTSIICFKQVKVFFFECSKSYNISKGKVNYISDTVWVQFIRPFANGKSPYLYRPLYQ